jgi:hypothetical protein
VVISISLVRATTHARLPQKRHSKSFPRLVDVAARSKRDAPA